jgi:hypothetical protein
MNVFPGKQDFMGKIPDDVGKGAAFNLLCPLAGTHRFGDNLYGNP